MLEQDKKLQDQAGQFQDLQNRLATVESYDGFEYEQDVEGEYSGEMECEGGDIGVTQKRNSESVGGDENNNSRFKSMAKRFKSVEQCDTNIDETLALNLTELFRNGIDEDRYEELIKSEAKSRPENCEGLVPVKMNQLIWDAVSTQARGTDRKLQNIETSVVKAASVLAKVVDKMAKMEADLANSLFGPMIDQCDDVFALLGHANRPINLARKDFLRPELNRDYSHLCSYLRPYTSQLFGDDVSKSARELEDCSKISNKMFQNKPFRGGPTRRRMTRGAFRFRGGYTRGARGAAAGAASGGQEPKNYQRRGGNRPPMYRH